MLVVCCVVGVVGVVVGVCVVGGVFGFVFVVIVVVCGGVFVVG